MTWDTTLSGVTITREGTTAYLKLGHHAPAVGDPDFFPMLVLDAVLTGPKGLNLWTSFRESAPQRQARLYTALVEARLASAVSGALLPTIDPFSYVVSATALDGIPLDAIEEAAVGQLEEVAQGGVTADELARAKRQLHARLVLEADSVTNLAHQIGYFETVATFEVCRAARSRVEAVTVDDTGRVAQRRFQSRDRTVGRFEPQPLRPS